MLNDNAVIRSLAVKVGGEPSVVRPNEFSQDRRRARVRFEVVGRVGERVPVRFGAVLEIQAMDQPVTWRAGVMLWKFGLRPVEE